MSLQPMFNTVGDASVVAAISAFEEVNKPGQNGAKFP
jgi:hypothetical protein